MVERTPEKSAELVQSETNDLEVGEKLMRCSSIGSAHNSRAALGESPDDPCAKG